MIPAGPAISRRANEQPVQYEYLAPHRSTVEPGVRMLAPSLPYQHAGRRKRRRPECGKENGMGVIDSCLIWGEGPAGGTCLGAVTNRRPVPPPSW